MAKTDWLDTSSDVENIGCIVELGFAVGYVSINITLEYRLAHDLTRAHLCC